VSCVVYPTSVAPTVAEGMLSAGVEQGGSWFKGGGGG
jgi:hypothetical protein